MSANPSSHPPLRRDGTLLIGEGHISSFGDAADVASGQDNGVGCTGYETAKNPLAPYCSLPIVYWQQFGLQPFQQVTVENPKTGRQVECFLADKGPGGTPDADRRLIDVSPSVLKRLRCDTDATVRIYIPVGRIVVAAKRC